MPLLVNQGSHDYLYDVEKNKADTKAFLAIKCWRMPIPETWAIPPGYRLIKRRHGSEVRLIKDNGILATVSVVKGVPADTPGLDECVTVFRYDYGANLTSMAHVYNPDGKRSSPLSEKECWWEDSPVGKQIALAFFNDTLTNAATYQTGTIQTEANKTFWLARATEALNENKFVYITTIVEGFSCSHTRIKKTEMLLAHWVDFCWGNDAQKHPCRTLMISNERLHID